jgi:hypothetical protein
MPEVAAAGTRQAELAQPPLQPRMSPWVGLCSSARRGVAGGASGWASPARAARKIPPLWTALRRLPPTASNSWTLFSSSETPLRCAGAHHQDRREARNCFDEGGVRILFSVTPAGQRPMVFSRQQPSGDLAELLRSHADLVIMDKEAAGSGGCSTTFHGRLGAGVTISIDAVPSVFRTGLLSQHPICRKLFSIGMGVQGNSNATTTAAAAAARIDKAVQEVYERFETACDDLDSGLFDLADRHCYCCMQFFAGAANSDNRAEGGHLWCMSCSYQVHGKGKRGGQRPDFATTERPNDRCSGCAGCSPVRR